MSASTAPSYLTDTLSSTRAFCVVCGKVSDDLELRGSGLKCKGCVGKRSNKHWVKLQKRQATQLLGEVSAPGSAARAMSSTFGTNSPPPTTMDLMTPLSDDMSATRPTHDSLTPTSSSVSGQRRGKRDSISDYITGTSVFQKALHRTAHDERPRDDSLSGTVLSDGGRPSRSGASTLSAAKPCPPSAGAHRAEDFSASSEHSTGSSYARPLTSPPAGGPPARRPAPASKSSRLSHPSSRPLSSTNSGPTPAVIHSTEIHIPHSRPSATSLTPQAITPSSKDPDTRRSGSGLTESERQPTVADLEAPKKSAPTTTATSSVTSPVTSPETTTLAPSKSVPSSSTVASPPPASSTGTQPAVRPARLPQRPSPGCVVSVIEPERGTAGSAGGHQRVVSFSTQDGATAGLGGTGHGEGQDGASLGDCPLDISTEPPLAPVAHSRCTSTVSCPGAPGARLPSRSPGAVTASKSPSKPAPPTALAARRASVDRDTHGSHAKAEEKGDEEEDHMDHMDHMDDDDDDEAVGEEDAASTASGSSSYITNESADHRGDSTAAADDKAASPPPLTLNLDRLDLAVRFLTPSQLAAEAQPVPETAEAAAGQSGSSRAGSQAPSLSASVSSVASSCSSTAQQRRSQVTVKGAFTVTRPMPNKSLHARTRSMEGAAKGLPGNGSAALTPAGTPTGQVEVRRLQFRFCVQDRDTGDELFHVDRGFFKEVMPALEAVRKVASASSGCPSLPSKTLPSFRYATDAYIEERRGETEALCRAVVKDAFLVRHPAMVKLLRLDPALHPDLVAKPTGSGAGGSRATQGVSATQKGTTGQARRRSSASSNTAAAPYLDSHSLDPLRQAATKASRGSLGSQASGHSSSRSSVVRRSRLDCVTAEDLEKVQLGAIIGRGSFGTVCQGYLQTASGPVVVAVKRVHVDPAVAEEGKDTLGEAQSELDILRKAKHKNVVRFLGSTFSPTTMELSVFTEYVECGTLASMVERFGCLPLLAIQKYMKQMLEGLRHLHQLSIIHRDIKGENVLVTKNGRVKLTDFGSSGVLNEVGSASVMPMGSPLWMAPEILHGEIAEASGDIWAVGCVGIEMLDRTIWTLTANDAVNPFVFMYRIGKLGTPPQGLPTQEEVDGFKARGEQEQYECFSVYRDFLVQCLQVKPENRWTAEQLLQHPFIHTPFSRFIRWQAPDAKSAEKSKP